MKKYLEKLSILSLYYREGLVGAWIGFLLGLIVGTLI
jgi:ABC-type antimicrobial peptide transport system permease subunit